MWPSLAYDAYTALGGSSSEAAFSAALPWAERAVRAACWPNVPATDAQEEAARAAIAAAIDADVETGGTHGTDAGGSFSIGGYSEGATGASAGARAAIRDAISEALAGSGLMCRVML